MHNDLLALIQKAAKAISEHEGKIKLISHYDADGITACAIMLKALKHAKKNFSIEILRELNKEYIDVLRHSLEDLIIFTDIGAGLSELIYKKTADSGKKIIIIDHHIPDTNINTNGFIHINSFEHKQEKFTSAALAWMVAKSISESNIPLVALAVVGTIGDCHAVAEDLLISDYVKREYGLNFFGRASRPIHHVLKYSFEPYIEGITGNELAALQLLGDINIKPKTKDGKWRVLRDLNIDELRALADAIIKYTGCSNIFSQNYTLNGFDGELADAKEFATLINACSRLGNEQLALRICCEPENKGLLEEARRHMVIYRRMLSNYLTWIRRHPECITETEHAMYINGSDKIDANVIGTITSMYVRRYRPDKPVISFAKNGEGVKISCRVAENSNINIFDVVSRAAAHVGGSGGGHLKAAGGNIPAGTIERFIEACEQEFRKIFWNHDTNIYKH